MIWFIAILMPINIHNDKKVQMAVWLDQKFLTNLDLACNLTDRTRSGFTKRALKKEMIEVFQLNGIEVTYE